MQQTHHVLTNHTIAIKTLRPLSEATNSKTLLLAREGEGKAERKWRVTGSRHVVLVHEANDAADDVVE